MRSLLSQCQLVGRELLWAARRMAHTPSFGVLAVATLAIGIGVNTAMFSVMDALLFRPPFHVADAERVVRVLYRASDSPDASVYEAASYPVFQDLRASRAFAEVAAYAEASVSIDAGVEATRRTALLVSHNFFDLLGVRPQLGAFFTADSTAVDGGGRVVISHDFWQLRFAGAPGVVGMPLAVDGQHYRIAGVAPRDFASLHAAPVDLWIPWQHASTTFAPNWRENRRSFWLSAVGRLGAGVSVGAAEERAGTVIRQRRAEAGLRRGPGAVTGLSVVPGRGGEQTRETRVALWLTGITAVVLLIACANVSNLVIVRNLARRREYAVRVSLGATSRRLMLQLLADVAVLVVPGTLLAVWISFAIRSVVPVFLSRDIPVARAVLDPRTMGVLFASAAVAFVAVAAVSLAQVSLLSATSSIGQQASSRAAQPRMRGALLAVQAGLCLVLVFFAGLFANSLKRVQSLDLGLQLDRTIQVTVDHSRSGKSPELIRAFYDQALVRLQSVSGVDRASLSVGSPYMSGQGASPRPSDRSHEELWADRESAYLSVVGAGFFTTVGARSLRGRDFTEKDRAGTPAVAIINAPLARHLWPSKDALGECLFMEEQNDCVRVVGVLGGVWKFRALQRDKMAIYMPLDQTRDAVAGTVFVRTVGDARTFVGQVRTVMQSIDPTLPAVQAAVAADLADPEFRPWRLGATMFGAFGAVALLVAAIGLYGVIALATVSRAREIGIRMALGARKPHIVRLVIGEALLSVTAGFVAGAALVLFAGRWLSGVVYETSPRDPIILGQTVLMLLITAALAAVIPTARALRTDPAKVMPLT